MIFQVILEVFDGWLDPAPFPLMVRHFQHRAVLCGLDIMLFNNNTIDVAALFCAAYSVIVASSAVRFFARVRDIGQRLGWCVIFSW